jgi:hypothetical protein
VWDVVGTGFGGPCVGRGARGVGEIDDAERTRRVESVWAVLRALTPDACAASASPDAPAEAPSPRPFSLCFACERALAFLARAVS